MSPYGWNGAPEQPDERPAGPQQQPQHRHWLSTLPGLRAADRRPGQCSAPLRPSGQSQPWSRWGRPCWQAERCWTNPLAKSSNKPCPGSESRFGRESSVGRPALSNGRGHRVLGAQVRLPRSGSPVPAFALPNRTARRPDSNPSRRAILRPLAAHPTSVRRASRASFQRQKFAHSTHNARQVKPQVRRGFPWA